LPYAVGESLFFQLIIFADTSVANNDDVVRIPRHKEIGGSEQTQKSLEISLKKMNMAERLASLVFNNLVFKSFWMCVVLFSKLRKMK